MELQRTREIASRVEELDEVGSTNAALRVLATDADGWTLRSKNGGRGAHAEHTIAITDDGPVVLTPRSS